MGGGWWVGVEGDFSVQLLVQTLNLDLKTLTKLNKKRLGKFLINKMFGAKYFCWEKGPPDLF